MYVFFPRIHFLIHGHLPASLLYFDANVCERITKQLNVRIYVILLGISAFTSAQLHGRSIPKMNEITKGWNALLYYNQILKCAS